MKKFDVSIVKDPKVNQENCLPPHSDHVCMPNWFEGDYNSFRMSLDGLWKFCYAKNMESAVVEFETEDYNAKTWDEIRVPTLAGEVSSDGDAVASYVKYFTLPINMRNERVCISFQGVRGSFAIWLNGHYVGYSENPFHPTEFELTPFLRIGENKLAVRVWNGSLGSVYLYMVHKTHLWDVQVLPELSDDFEEGTLTIITTSCGKGEVEVRLLDGHMEPVLDGVMVLEEGEEGSDEIQSGIAGMVYQPKLWSSEEPNLYVLQLEVRDENGDLTEVTSLYVGFRRFEKKDDIMYLNGKPMVLCGVNWHECSKSRGCIPNRGEILKDIITMKRNNINAVHTRRSLSSSDVFELCDEYGLYVFAEDSCYSKDKNHPSILDWSKGNEMPFELSPNMQQVKYKYQNITIDFSENTFTVWNKNLFISTEEYDAFISLQKDGESIVEMPMAILVEPLEKKRFDIPQQILSVMDNLKIASAVHDGETPELAVTVSFVLPKDNVWGKRGYEVAFGQHVYKREVQSYSCTKAVEVTRDENDIIVKGEHFKATFSSLNAGLLSYVYGGVEMLKSIPHPNFWRAPAKDEEGRRLAQQYAQWKIASMYAVVRKQDPMPVMEEMENSIKLTYIYDMPTNPANSCQVSYQVFGDGTIETTMVYEPVEGLIDMPEFGMLFKLDANFNCLKWYGLGPEETYADSMCGAKLGVYENKVADNMVNYKAPQECGNKCGVRYAQVTDERGRGMRFFGDELSFSALPYTPHELENAADVYELPQVHHTVVRVSQQQMKKVFTFYFRGV